MLNGALMPKLEYYMPWYWFIGGFTIIGGSLRSTETSPSRICGHGILMAIGAGSALQCGYGIAATKVKSGEVTTAIGSISVVQTDIIVIALTITGNVFQSFAVSSLKYALSANDFTDA